jgi:hypothetical protein
MVSVSHPASATRLLQTTVTDRDATVEKTVLHAFQIGL